MQIFYINLIKMKSLKALNSTLQFGCGSRTAKYRAAPAGADGGSVDPMRRNKIDAKRSTKLTPSESIAHGCTKSINFNF